MGLEDWERIVINGILDENDRRQIHVPRSIVPENSPAAGKLLEDIIEPIFPGRTVWKSHLESTIYPNTAPESVLDFYSKLGSGKHRAAYTGIRSTLAGKNKSETHRSIALSRGIQDVGAAHQKSFLAETPNHELRFDAEIADAEALKDNLFTLYGLVNNILTEVTFKIPVKYRPSVLAGEFNARADVVVISDKVSGIVDFKTGAIPSTEQQLFNLIVLALEWSIWKHSSQKVEWNGKKITCKSRVSLSAIAPEDGLFAIIWPGYIVTNQTIGLTEHEISKGVSDIHHLLLHQLATPQA